MELSDKMKAVVKRIELEHSQDIETILFELYITKQLTYRKILKLLSINNRSVKILLDFCNIPIRYGGDAIKTQWVNNDARRISQAKLLQAITTGNPSYRLKKDEDVAFQCYKNGYKLLNREFVNKKTQYTTKCKNCSSILKLGYFNLTKIHCSGKIRSRGELKVIEFLESKDIKFETQHYIFDGIKRMFFDFKVVTQKGNFLIEYDGRQHFQKKSKFYSKKVVENDIYKNLYCINNNLKLVRIPFFYFSNL